MANVHARVGDLPSDKPPTHATLFVRQRRATALSSVLQGRRQLLALLTARFLGGVNRRTRRLLRDLLAPVNSLACGVLGGVH